MRRLAPLVGVAVALGSLTLLLLVLGPLGTPDAAPPERGDASDPGDRSRPRPSTDAAARTAMDRAVEAPSSWAYQGTQVVAAMGGGGDEVSQVIEVTHTPEEGTTWRAATGGAGINAASHSAEPSLLGVGAVGLMARYYSLRMAAPDRVAGRTADVVEAYRPGRPGAHPAARFWLDRESGIVLRREVYAPSGKPIRASGFFDVAVHRAAPATTEPGSGDGGADHQAGGRAWSRTLDASAVDRMKRHGWDCPSRLPGPLELVDARRGGEGSSVVHLSYADGISSLSLFLLRGSLPREELRGFAREQVSGDTVWVSDDVPRRVVWSSGGTVYAVVADAPRRTVDRAVVVLHASASQGQKGPVDRLGRGLDRVASWFNPFE